MGPASTLGTSRHLTLPDGRRLHLMESGAGETTVVFESGLGMSRSIWGLVVPEVAPHARCVVYDRAGLGRSDPDPAPRTLERLTGDLLALLADLGKGPFVLVGHSWGGPVVRCAAASPGPRAVRGIVLVDQTDERCDLYFEPSAARRFAFSAKLPAVLARTGLYRVVGGRPGRKLPPDARADHLAEDFSRPAALSMARELEPFLDDLGGLREVQPVLDGVPLTVISGTRPVRMDRKVRAQIVAAHRETAAAHPNGRFVEAKQSAHLIMFDEPKIVADEILRLI